MDQTKLMDAAVWSLREEAEETLYDTATVTTLPGLEDSLEMLQVVYADIQQLTDIH